GLVPNTGQWPMAENEAAALLGTGPLARRAEDLWPLLKVLAGPDGECSACRPMELGDPARVSIGERRVLDVADNIVTPVSKELREAQQKVARALAGRGASVRSTRFDRLRRSLHYWSAS